MTDTHGCCRRACSARTHPSGPAGIVVSVRSTSSAWPSRMAARACSPVSASKTMHPRACSWVEMDARNKRLEAWNAEGCREEGDTIAVPFQGGGIKMRHGHPLLGCFRLRGDSQSALV